jgi:arsenate reductase
VAYLLSFFAGAVYTAEIFLSMLHQEDVEMEQLPMNIQIFGTNKCADTRKAQRFFKERGIRFQFVDLTEKGLSKGELRSVAARVALDQLLDRASPRFVAKGLAHAWLDATKIESLLLEDPLLFRTPIVRNGKEATAGHCPEVWKTWQ